MLVAHLGSDTMTEKDPVAIEVELPQELLTEIDEFATRNGYVTQSGVVRRARERREE
jgi:metal-responsive CopG/Arc/MetJ family transcriptional regulator